MMSGGGPFAEHETAAGPAGAASGDVPVKLEIFEEDPLEEEYGPVGKRARLSCPLQQQWGAGANAFLIPPSQYNPLDEPSPLGLRLRKSPSLLDLIQMKLSQASNALEAVKCEDHSMGVKIDSENTVSSGVTADKMKASNFPGSVLKIGQWEYKSRYEGDLVAKCYFAKRKLVWEILEGGLKSKIEMQWSDIVAIRAEFSDSGPGQLNVVLGKQPLFFRETNPQPRKHTLWQATWDFTDGQASTHRQHQLECPPDLLKKNFEKLIQCDGRLNHLSQQGKIVVTTPHFEINAAVSVDSGQPKTFGKVHDRKDSTTSSVKESNSAQPSSLTAELSDSTGAAPESRFRDISSPNSVSGESRSSEASGAINIITQEQFMLPGLSKSMSVSDLMNHIGRCITENVDSCTMAPADGECGREILEDIAQHLLSDSQLTTVSDENSLMSRVNSLCSLLHMDPLAPFQVQQTRDGTESSGGQGEEASAKVTAPGDAVDSPVASESTAAGDKVPMGEEPNDVSSSCKQQLGMSRKDSFGDLLLHLPRIASLPQFLFDISEEDL